jgi:hypothetical protein
MMYVDTRKSMELRTQSKCRNKECDRMKRENEVDR